MMHRILHKLAAALAPAVDLKPVFAVLLLGHALPALPQPAGTATSTDPGRETIFILDSLEDSVEILIDRWGVPHIFAANQDDMFFAQGFNAARDRLWQLDLWRRRGDGTLSEAFGEAHLEQDRAARLLLFRGEMYREWLAYASDTKRIVTAFVEGINAYIELTEQQPELLPPEFTLLDYRPRPWSPETVVRIRSHGLLRNLRSEISRGRFLATHGEEAAHFRDWLEPEHRFQIPQGLEPADLLASELMTSYLLGTATTPRAPLGKAVAELGTVDDLLAQSVPSDDFSQGSNNWALAPRLTTTGRPLLADDPHRTQAVPSLRYIAHLSSPGLDIIGAGEPALPGVSIGHNGTIAFGLTIFSIDQEDLYVYETHPDDPTRYRYLDEWRSMRKIEEVIPVRLGDHIEQRTATLLFSHHGPILFQDSQNHRAYALRAAWLEPGMAPYLGSIEYMRARNWDQFLAAMNRWGAPSENQVYADTAGNIGWKPGGLAPIRPNWDGLLPVPGDGRYEWQGFYDADQLPAEYNPTRGWVATANQMNLPAGYPEQLGFEWAAPYRFERIAEVLSQPDRKFSLQDMLDLQTDYESQPARRLVEVLSILDSQTKIKGAARRGSDLLKNWDAQLEPTSAPAALFEVWWRRHLLAAILEVEATRNPAVAGARDSLVDQASRERLLRICERSIANREPAMRAAVLTSLASAYDEVESLLGPDSGSWQWGSLHTMLFEHPLADALPDDFRQRASIGPLPRGGSGETVGNTNYDLETFRQRSGASFRMVIDVGNWDGSIAMNSPGQSGIPGNRHYDDLFEPWATDRAFPLLYSRAAIELVTTDRFRLVPPASAPD